MYEALEQSTYITRDARGRVLALRPAHIVPAQARTPREAAASYLISHAAELGLTGGQINGLLGRATADPQGLKHHADKSFHQLRSVAWEQTWSGLPVASGGLAVHIKQSPLRVIAATSQILEGVDPEPVKDAELKRALGLSSNALRGILGVSSEDDLSVKLRNTRAVVLRYDPATRLGHAHTEGPFATAPLPFEPDSPDLQEGADRVAIEALFDLRQGKARPVAWTVWIDVAQRTVLRLLSHRDNVDGLVFQTDPITASGSTTQLPSATTTTLNPARSSVTLLGLDAPAPGADQELTGANVQISDFEPATSAPPTEAVGTDFDYDSRTNDFAAVNAYYHCDRFFRIVEDLGFSLGTYFDGTSLPLQVDHRGRFGTTDGIEINASCSGDGSGGIANCDFELADLGDTTHPLGMATTWRVVLHELGGHGILHDHVTSPNFGFAHSAGDSFAAILNDPRSQAPDRFDTFPWVAPGMRRHDRTPASGWGFGGASDTGGYNTEQILSTTHFRLYRSLGGDAASPASRERAARVSAYLMLRAVGALTPATNPTNAAAWATALIAADQDDWSSEGWAGGAYGKVIRWAFEKQGLYKAVGAASTDEGAPPDVDVYIEDGRGGEYDYQAVHWQCTSIWNRRDADGGTTHEPPVVGRTNYAYVKIKNRGTQTATNVQVRGYHCIPGAGLTWPDDWQAMSTAQLAAPDLAPNSASEVTVGPFEWIPSQVGHECMLMIASATGDAANTDNLDTGETIPEWRLVPHDNNIGQRNVQPVAADSDGSLEKSLNGQRFLVRNPGRKVATMTLDARLPGLLTRLGWSVRFTNPGGGAFRLQPGQAREVAIRVEPGASFDGAQLDPTDTLQVLVSADGELIGGMTYALDPTPQQSADRSPSCEDLARDLVSCLHIDTANIRSVRVRRITLDIELDDCD